MFMCFAFYSSKLGFTLETVFLYIIYQDPVLKYFLRP